MEIPEEEFAKWTRQENSMECPDQKCRDNVTRFTFFLKIFSGALGILATIILVSGLSIVAGENLQNEKIAEIEVVKKDIEHIKEKVNDIEESQERMEMQQQTIIQNQIQPEVLKLLIKEAVKSGNN